MLSYVVYHHFRSLGWVVRSGIKFGVDFLLYNRGPVFSHAEFAIIILPSYGHPHYFKPEVDREEIEAKEKKSWWWLHCVNRVQSQVKKSLLMVYVEVPPPASSDDNGGEMKNRETNDISGLLKMYRVREVSLKRWIPNRTRD
jgi:tRNA-splicing endonuclease subunit Sen2